MSITMKNVKAITHSSKNVKKIEDSNELMIWGSWDDFPYRKLKYIHFNGAERIDTDFYPGTNSIYYTITCSTDELVTSGNRSLMDLYDNSLTNNMKRFYFLQQNSTGLHACLGDTWSSYSSSTPVNSKISITGRYTKESNKPTLYYTVQDVANSWNTILSANPLQQNTAGDLSTTVPLPLGCRVVSNNGYSYDYYWKGNLYSLQRRSNNSSGTLLTDYIPVQRKSDGVCGMYDNVTGIFHPMVGTTITDSAAGPVEDEYMIDKLNQLISSKLAGKTVTFNNNPTRGVDGTYNFPVSFVLTNDSRYEYVSMQDSNRYLYFSVDGSFGAFGTVQVYDNDWNLWANDDYKTITFTGTHVPGVTYSEALQAYNWLKTVSNLT